MFSVYFNISVPVCLQTIVVSEPYVNYLQRCVSILLIYISFSIFYLLPTEHHYSSINYLYETIYKILQ